MFYSPFRIDNHLTYDINYCMLGFIIWNTELFTSIDTIIMLYSVTKFMQPAPIELS